MFGFLKKALLDAGAEAARRDLTQAVRLVGAMTEEELGMILVSTLKTLFVVRRRKSSEGFATVFAALDDISVLRTKKDRGMVSFLVMQLKQDHAGLARNEAASSQFAAVGLMMVIHSLRVLAYPVELLPEGRSLWQHLLKGQRHLPQMLVEQLSREMLEGNLGGILMAPVLLAPDFDREDAARQVRETAAQPINNLFS